MLRRSLILVISLIPALGLAQATTREAPQRVVATSRPHLIADASQPTLVRNHEDVVITLSEAADTAGASGDLAAFERLTARKREYTRMIDGLRNRPLPTSLYPLEVGRRGGLYGVLESQTLIKAGEQRVLIPLYVITWFRVKPTGKRPDGTVSAEVYEGGSVLYRVLFEGVEQLSAGGTSILPNMQFECTEAESDDAGMIYHLRRLEE